MFGIVWVLKRKRTSEMRAAGEVEVLWMGQHVPPPPLAQRQRSLNSIVPHSYETFTLTWDSVHRLWNTSLKAGGWMIEIYALK